MTQDKGIETFFPTGESQRSDTVSTNRGELSIRSPISIRDLETALEAYICGKVSVTSIVDWANFVELSDEVDYEEGKEDAIADALFIISNPEMNGPLSIEIAKDLLSGLSQDR